MSLRLQIILLILLAIGMAVVVNMVRKRVLELKYVLAWMFADIVLVFLVSRTDQSDHKTSRNPVIHEYDLLLGISAFPRHYFYADSCAL